MDDAAFVQQVLRNKADYYAALGIQRGAGDNDISRAYKKAALRLHPDKNKHPRAEEAFKIVNTAKATLADPAKRRTYDRHGEEGVKAEESTGSPHAQRGGGGYYQRRQAEAEVFEDIFGMFGMFPGGGMRGGAQRRGHPGQQRQQQQQQGGHHHEAGVELGPGMMLFIPLLFFVLFAFFVSAYVFVYFVVLFFDVVFWCGASAAATAGRPTRGAALRRSVPAHASRVAASCGWGYRHGRGRGRGNRPIHRGG